MFAIHYITSLPISHKVSKAFCAFGDEWQTHIILSNVYFQTLKCLYRHDNDTISILKDTRQLHVPMDSKKNSVHSKWSTQTQLEQLLANIFQYSPDMQKQILKKLANHMKDTTQCDDILLIGIKL